MGAEQSNLANHANPMKPPVPVFQRSSVVTLTEEPLENSPAMSPHSTQAIPIPLIQARRNTLPSLPSLGGARAKDGFGPLRRFSLAAAAAASHSSQSFDATSPPENSASVSASAKEYLPFSSYRGQSLRRLSIDDEIKSVAVSTNMLGNSPPPLLPAQHQLPLQQPLPNQQQQQQSKKFPVDFVAWASFD